ncbi:hypothetical protein COCON_G00090070 [Conger conger]|uniref:C-C motif chemokine n=1 Tax=Conger conger TaxID=82655 RepID=A0A9Q1DKS4_CONCO|nr:hypothetical protein COCON_G00090070 [Conger conger]
MMTLPAVFLCLAVLLLSPGPGEASSPVVSCCLKTENKKIPVIRVDRYSMQKKGLCPVDAVIFTSVKGITICSNPSDRWAKRAMAIVDSRRQTKVTTDIASPHPSTEATTMMLSTKDKTAQ